MLGNVNTTCLGSFGFAVPANFEPSTLPPEPVWVYVPDTITLTAQVGAQVVARYDLPAARNGVVSCLPAPGSPLFSATTRVNCVATGPSGQRITAGFDIVIERQEIMLAGPDFNGVTFIGNLAVSNNQELTVSTGNTAFLLVANGAVKPGKDVQTPRGSRTSTSQGDTVTGATKGAPRTPMKGELESDRLTVFEVETDDNGLALWSFEIPDDFPPGEHTLYISGVGANGQLFTDVFPIVVEGTAAASTPPSLSAALGSATDAVAVDTGTGVAQTDDPTTTTGPPLAYTGSAGGRLAMIGLWLMLFGSLTLGVRRRIIRTRLSS